MSLEEDELMKKEIEREEAVVEVMLETLMSCWMVQKDLRDPLMKDLEELLFYAPLTGESFLTFKSFCLYHGGR